MFSDKTFQIAFLVSLFTHTFILFQSHHLQDLSPFKDKQKDNIEISYIKASPKKTEYIITTMPSKETPAGFPSRITFAKRAPPPFIDKENIFREKDHFALSQRSPFTKSSLVKPELKPDIIAVKKKITLPAVDIDKINNPTYLGYYQIVREKIRRAAYQNYARTDTGEVYISFIISSLGYLEEVHLVEEKSIRNTYLKDIALKSIRDASPFPKFPQELNYPQLSFNVIISFEIE